MTEALHIRGESADDVPEISALVQDMAVKAGELAWLPAQRRLALVGNRFRWEAKDATRVRSALRIDHVRSAQRLHWPPDGALVLALLAIETAIEAEGERLTLIFSGGAALRLEAEVIDISLDDISGPWGASSRPKHRL